MNKMKALTLVPLIAAYDELARVELQFLKRFCCVLGTHNSPLLIFA